MTRKSIALCLGLIAALILVIAVAIWFTPPPQLQIEYQDSTIAVSADRAWVLRPGDCLRVSWDQQGRQLVHVEGIARHQSGQLRFCPGIGSAEPRIELTDHVNAFYRSYSLETQYLPDFVINLLGVSGLAFFGVLALYYLWTKQPDRRPSFGGLLAGLLALLLCIALLRLTGRALTTDGVLAMCRNVFSDVRWQLAGVVLALGLYSALAVEAVWQGIRHRKYSEFLVVACFFAFVALLYLPFGIDAFGAFEDVHSRAYIEGAMWPRESYKAELSSRFWLFLPHALGFLLSSESFQGFYLVHASLLCGRLVLLYGIQLRLGIPRLYAFLITILFAIYPIDELLFSLRSLPQQFSFLCFLAAVYLLLSYMKCPTRLRQIGLWIALLLCVGAYESVYGLILVTPLICWYRNRDSIWRNLNLTLVWYIVPACKIAYMALVLLAGSEMYRSRQIITGNAVTFENLLPRTVARIIEVFRHTFVTSWAEAFNALSQNSWMPVTIVTLGCVALVAGHLWLKSDADIVAAPRQLAFSLFVGLLLVVPSLGVLLLLDTYSRDPSRLYLHVAIPAAVVVFSVIALLASSITSKRSRDAVLALACLSLTLPGVSYLLSEHDRSFTSANNSAQILSRIVQLAPGLASETRVLVIGNMSPEAWQDKRIDDLESNMIGSALFVLHGGGTSGVGFGCRSAVDCDPLETWGDNLSNTLVFVLDENLNLQRVNEPQFLYQEFRDLDYDVSALFNPDAPPPSRAYTMLGVTRPQSAAAEQ